MDQVYVLEPTVEEMIEGLLGRLSEGLVIAVIDGKVSTTQKFRENDSGVLNNFLVCLLQELLKRTHPANEV